MTRPVIIIAPPPTPNGDLHLGHLAGPYLAGDVCARYLRACGRPVIYATGTDDSQTYVVATARRQGVTPTGLARRCWNAIRQTLDVAGIAVDGFAPFDDRYQATVIDFVTALHKAGKFRRRHVRMPYAPRIGEFLMEGLICGDCPVCLCESRGGLCETCGHPNTFDELLDPRSTVDPNEPLVTREAEVLVFPMEEYRGQLASYYAEPGPGWRPHMTELVRQVLSRPLPDFPVTYPYHWGIPAPFPEAEGQVINAWVEGMPASMYCTAYASEQMRRPAGPTDELWRAEHDARVVYFLGFDNAYFWGVTHLALLMAHNGRYVVPDTIVCNEFYELEHEKFSTSKGHVVWIRDLLEHVPRDVVRFYLALTAPEHQLTSFGRAPLVKVAGDRLVWPWNRLAGALGDAVTRLAVHDRRLPVPDRAIAHAELLVEQFRHHYELDAFSMGRAASAIAAQVARLERRAQQIGDGPEALADLGGVYHELVALLTCAAPILVDLATQVRERTGMPLTFSVPASSTDIHAFDVPALHLATISGDGR